MDFSSRIKAAESNPEQLEVLYQSVVKEGQESAFRDALVSAFEADKTNLLLAAWYHRLLAQGTATISPKPEPYRPKWWLAVPTGLLTGLIYWSISARDMQFLEYLPYFVLLWAPITAAFLMGFLVLAGRRGIRRAAVVSLALAAACAYVFLIAPTQRGSNPNHYLDLMIFHIPLLSFVAVGVTLVGLPEDRQNRFAFLIKSLEVFITAGLFGIAGMIFVGITAGMFETLGVDIPEWIVRLALSLGGGMIPVLAVVTIYDPGFTPYNQDFSQGLSQLIATLMRILLPLTFGVLLVYLFFIPFNFMGPFENRDVLIIYNVMLFAIMALLVGAIPVKLRDLSDRVQVFLRRGIVAVAALAVLVSVYALAAIVYRTIGGGITVNRLTVIGWNSINILTLILLIVRQARADRETWLSALHSVFSTAAYGYVAWGLFIVVAIPLLFR